MLLGLLLGAPGARAEPLPRYGHRGGELLLMIRTGLLHLVRRQRALPLRRQFLQRGLEVAVALAADVGLHPRTEQPLDQLGRDLEATVQVDSTEDRLERIGE